MAAQDATHWDRGTGDCRLSFTAQGQRLLGARAGEVRARFANGPILRVVEAADGQEAAAVHSLARFDSEFRAPVGVAFFMAGSPAIVGGAAGSKTSSWQRQTWPPTARGAPTPVPCIPRTSGTTGGCCGRGLVTLFSPHLEDGADEAAKAPFRNAIRLCSSFCQHVRTSGAGPEQMRHLLESISCTDRDPSAEGESAATPPASPSPPPSAPPLPPP